MTPQNMEQGEMKNLLAKVRQWEGPTASRRASMASVASLAEGERRVSVSKTPTGHMANMGGIMANMASNKSIFSIAASAFSMTSGFSEAPKDYGAAPGVNSPNETLTRPRMPTPQLQRSHCPLLKFITVCLSILQLQKRNDLKRRAGSKSGSRIPFSSTSLMH